MNALKMIAICLTSTLVMTTHAEDRLNYGEQEYMNSCAVCHGNAGEGVGTFSGYLSHEPPAINSLTKINHGVFPTEYLHRIIDGSESVALHGPREMPIWGRQFHVEALRLHEFDERVDADKIVYERIRALLSYIESLQTD